MSVHCRRHPRRELHAGRYVNTLIPSLTETEAPRHYERCVAPYFTADGRHHPSVAAQAVSSVAEELGVPTVPDAADIYHTEPAEASAASPRTPRGPAQALANTGMPTSGSAAPCAGRPTPSVLVVATSRGVTTRGPKPAIVLRRVSEAGTASWLPLSATSDLRRRVIVAGRV